VGRRPDGSIDIDDYIAALGGGGAKALGYGHLRQAPRPGAPSHQPPPPREVRRDVDAERPYLVGWAPAEASTNTELARVEPMIWDVNRYYRDLGFSWPYTPIGRKELMRAYQERGGPDDVRLTYCFHQLLNEYVRWEYDRMPLGELFFDDYMAEDLRRRAVGEAHRRRVEHGEEVEAEAVFKEWGLESTDEAPEESARERYEAAQEEDRRKRLTSAQKAADTWWGWSYYIWRARPELGMNHRLARWQKLLLEEFSKKNARVRFCVGIVGRQPHPWVTGEVGQRTVVFLNEDPALNPTSAMAESAVAFVLSDHANHTHQ
jgi:hypothetical protein